MNFTRWIANTDPIIHVGYCEDLQCFFCGGETYQRDETDVRTERRIWHAASCPWLLAIEECLPVDGDAHCNTCGHAMHAHIYYEGACRPGYVCEVGCEKFVKPKQRRERAA